jgi:predicted PhzF superfamily epimerase YddE/YHI9
MRLTIYHIDAFARHVFKGNPAAICPLEKWPEDALMQSIAAENNLSETAFFAPDGDEFKIRWFTPTSEIDLCGHATLAAGWVLYHERGFKGDRILFKSENERLEVTRERDMLVLNFPARPAKKTTAPTGLGVGLGAKPKAVLAARDYLCVFESEKQVRELRPDFAALKRLDKMVIVTAKGKDCDFVSRFFAPGLGVDEDPVTGSAHCTLVPYWAHELGKEKLHAVQVSKRGGELFCELLKDRVKMAGRATKYLEGFIEVPEHPAP